MTILEMENKRLFVGNLFPEVTSEDLENKFSRYHTLTNNNHSMNRTIAMYGNVNNNNSKHISFHEFICTIYLYNGCIL